MPIIKCPKCQNTFDFSKYEFEVASELSCSDEIEKECPFCEYIIKIKRKKKDTFENTPTANRPQLAKEPPVSMKKSRFSIAGQNTNGEFDLQLDRSGEPSFIQKTKVYIFGKIKTDKPILFFKELAIIFSLTLFSLFLLAVYNTDFMQLRNSIYKFLLSILG